MSRISSVVAMHLFLALALASAPLSSAEKTQQVSIPENGLLQPGMLQWTKIQSDVRDKSGYGDIAWDAAYGMMALNALYEARNKIGYIEVQREVVNRVLPSRDVDLAARFGADLYEDRFRKRTLKSWGSSAFSDGQHTCWLVHAGMLVYPMARYVHLVETGGETTRAYIEHARGIVPALEEALGEFEPEFRIGPGADMGYYVSHVGRILPNNQYCAAGLACLALHDITGKDVFKTRAAHLARYFKSRLTLVASGDYYVWAYQQGTPESPPGQGDDISHAAICAEFMYECWNRGVVFDEVDMQRVTRTFTKGLYQGKGQFAANLGGGGVSAPTNQCSRWTFLARFDPYVETAVYEFLFHNSRDPALVNSTGLVRFSYLERANKLRNQVTEKKSSTEVKAP